jgi:amino acid transporter
MVYISVCAAAPLAVAGGAMVVAYGQVPLVNIPAAYAVAAVVLMVWAVGYVAASRHVVSSGPFYSLIRAGLGQVAGVGAAAVAVLTYMLMTVGLVGGVGGGAALGFGVPWWVGSLVATVLIGLAGIGRVGLSMAVLAVLMSADLAVTVLFDGGMLAHPAAGFSLAPLSPAGLLTGGPVLTMGSIASYQGFELAAVYAAEARYPQRTVARAVMTTLAAMAVVYGLSAWALTVATGVDRIHSAAAADPFLFFTLGGSVFGAGVALVARLLFLTSLFAAALAFHNTVARYLFALGGEGVLAGWLGRSNRWQAPYAGSVVCTLVTAAGIILAAAVGADPLVHLFLWLTVAGGLGLVWLLAATSIAVVVIFASRPRETWTESVWQRRIAPTVAAVALLLIGSAATPEMQVLLQVPDSSWWRWLIPAAMGVALLAGVGRGLAVGRRDRRASVLDSPGAPGLRVGV